MSEHPTLWLNRPVLTLLIIVNQKESTAQLVKIMMIGLARQFMNSLDLSGSVSWINFGCKGPFTFCY